MFEVKHGPYSDGTAVSMKWDNVHIKFLSKHLEISFLLLQKLQKLGKLHGSSLLTYVLLWLPFTALTRNVGVRALSLQTPASLSFIMGISFSFPAE